MQSQKNPQIRIKNDLKDKMKDKVFKCHGHTVSTLFLGTSMIASQQHIEKASKARKHHFPFDLAQL